ncbi:MAG: substrate-binding domain-containing protein, partial [Patescibacteria group bacterium]|nr:substrate-binding domain-containing protein [Patescibacteria group bacterium]
MKRRTRSVFVLAMALLSVGAIGCSRQDAADSDHPGSGKPRIALVMKSLANEFFSTMADGAKEHQQANADKYELIVNGIKDERDLARQVSLVEDMTAQGVQAIVIAPADS